MPFTTPVYTHLFQPIWSRWFPSIVPEQFTFPAPGLAFATTQSVFTTLACYIVLVHAGQRLFAQSWMPAFHLRPLFFLHNVLLSAGSLLLLLLIAENLFPRLLRHGLMWGVCHRDVYEADRRLELYFYLNYLFKFYELLDTLFLVVKKKKVEFLHWFHHSMTMLLCYTQLVGRTSVSWVPITLNLWVHVVMYYYYARTSISKKPIWWKKHLTTMQILQFIIDLLVINFCIFVRHAYANSDLVQAYTGLTMPFIRWDTGLPFLQGWVAPAWVEGVQAYSSGLWAQRADCYGTYEAGYFGWLIINSYLLLFIQFFRKTYKQKTKTQ